MLRRPQKAEEWLIWMQDNDVKPNEAHSRRAAIRKLCASEPVECVQVSYNSVINACAQTGYVERAEMWSDSQSPQYL